MRGRIPALVIAFYCVASAVARSQEPAIGPRIRIDHGGGTAAANETTVAASEVNPLEVVAAWNDWRASTAEEVRSAIGLGLSFDGGETWNDSLLDPPEGFRCDAEGDPMTAADPRTGTLWAGGVTFFCGVFVARKDPGAPGFKPAVMALESRRADKPWMAAGPRPGEPESTRLYIALNVGLIYSDDMGDTWSDPLPLGEGLGHLPRVGPSGELYIAYWDVVSRMMLKRSLDGAKTFTTHIIAVRRDPWPVESRDRFPGSFRVPPYVYLALSPTAETLYAVFPDTTEIVDENRDVDLYFTKSSDAGNTWGDPVALHAGEGIPGDQFFPWIETDRAGRLHMVFLDSRHTAQDDGVVDGMFDAYYAYSLDQGDSWREVRLTESSWNSAAHGRPDRPREFQFHGDYLGLAVTRERVLPVYLDTGNGDPDIITHVIDLPIHGPLVRGDCNNDGGSNLTDAVYLLLFLFGGSPARNVLDCVDSCDANDDGSLDVSDAVAVLISLFLDPLLPQPFPDCGPDPTGDALSCAAFSSCI